MKKTFIASLICGLLVTNAHASTVIQPLSFVDTSQLENQLIGSLEGSVKFAQTHTIFPTGNDEKELPHLVSNRNALFLFTPIAEHIGVNLPYVITVLKEDGTILGRQALRMPKGLPRNDNPNLATAEKPDVIYSDKTWSASIPWNWIQPNIQIIIEDVFGNEGLLPNIDVGAENEILINNIRIGMLTPPKDKVNRLEHEAKLAADFFQKVPVSKLIVANYSPIFLDKIVLADGTVYLDESSDIGDWHNGDMRNGIAKSLISGGINAANFGLSSSSIDQPKFFNQYVAHIARGKYSNGIVDHGYSGGAGMVTLSDTVGNEFSHEMGHNFGLGHYPGGGQWATQNLDSGWGWDDFQQRFIANFLWNETGDADSQGYLTPPFAGIYRFNRDAMGGGGASSPISEYTLYTGYSQKRIQKNFETTGRISETMESGYAVWDKGTQSMVDRQDSSRLKPKIFGTAVTTIVGYYDPQNELPSYIYPALHGSYGHVYDFGEVKSFQCRVLVTFADGQTRKIGVEWEKLDPDLMNQFHINVETSLNPVKAEVKCPIIPQYAEWRGEYLGTLDFKAWDSTKQGKVGDIYRYKTSGGERYFKLLTSNYSNFPTRTNSNSAWEFVADEATMRPEYEDEIMELTPDMISLDSRTLQQPSEQPRPTIIVGEEFGYGQVISQDLKDTLTFHEQSHLSGTSFHNIQEFSTYISNLYRVSQVQDLNISNIALKIGEIYTKKNLSTGKHEYFKLKKISTIVRFPTESEAENDLWLYLGAADKYINHSIDPLRLTLEEGLTVDQRLLNYFDQEKLLNWSERETIYFSDSDVNLFVYDNPYSLKREYFVQKLYITGSGGWFPTNAESNKAWFYIGNQSDIKVLVDTVTNDYVYFNELVASWYQKSDLKLWDASKVGVVGDIYLWNYGGRYNYYRLNTTTYTNFPTPLGKSNNAWGFLDYLTK